MRNHWVSYLLAALIALQSVVTLADIHQVHETDTEHVTFDQDLCDLLSDTSRQTTSADAVSGNDADTSDGHHCCQCHGHFSQVLPGAAAMVDFVKHPCSFSPYRVGAAPIVFTSFLRPPITSRSV